MGGDFFNGKEHFTKKKIYAAAIAVVIMLSGCAPGEPSESEQSSSEVSSSDSTSSSSSSSSESSIPDASETPSEEEKYADAPAPVIASRTMPEDYSGEPVEFKTEIDEFNAQVKELPIPDEYKGSYGDYTSQGYSVRKLEIDGIPLYEVKKDDGTPKPLLIQIHGGGWHKDLNYAANLAAEGFCAVSIDCAGSGESQDGPIQAPAAFMETVKDIDTLVEYYNTKSDVDASNFGLIGSSMGGNIALNYVVYGKYKPTAITAENACPDPLTDHGPIWDCFDKGQNWQTSVWTDEQLEEFVAKVKPINYPEYFKDVWVYACCGELDEDNPLERMENLKNAVEALGGEKFVLKIYEGIGHETPQSWFDVETREFFGKLKGNN